MLTNKLRKAIALDRDFISSFGESSSVASPLTSQFVWWSAECSNYSHFADSVSIDSTHVVSTTSMVDMNVDSSSQKIVSSTLSSEAQSSSPVSNSAVNNHNVLFHLLQQWPQLLPYRLIPIRFKKNVHQDFINFRSTLLPLPNVNLIHFRFVQFRLVLQLNIHSWPNGCFTVPYDSFNVVAPAEETSYFSHSMDEDSPRIRKNGQCKSSPILYCIRMEIPAVNDLKSNIHYESELKTRAI